MIIISIDIHRARSVVSDSRMAEFILNRSYRNSRLYYAIQHNSYRKQYKHRSAIQRFPEHYLTSKQSYNLEP